MQDLTRIDEAVERGELARNVTLREAFSGAERVHLLGLVSDGGVHSGWRHLEALIALGAELRVPDLVLHAFTDGRDTLPQSGAAFLATVEGWMRQAGSGRVGSVPVVPTHWDADHDGSTTVPYWLSSGRPRAAWPLPSGVGRLKYPARESITPSPSAPA